MHLVDRKSVPHSPPKSVGDALSTRAVRNWMIAEERLMKESIASLSARRHTSGTNTGMEESCTRGDDMSVEQQIEEMAMTPLDILANDINQHCHDLKDNYCGDTHCVACLANALYNAGYRKQTEVIDEFAERLKEAPIRCGLPLFGLSTKEEIEEYFNGIMIQVRDAIDGIAQEMKGGAE